MKLAIIGTAGRKDDAARLGGNPGHYYRRMLDAARQVAIYIGADTLVSGGAAWADFMAIALYLEPPNKYQLELHLPAPFCVDAGRGWAFLDTGGVSWITNPGGTANHYLRQFAKQCEPFGGEDFPWKQYKTVQADPEVWTCRSQGFKERNLEVAKADHCLAMTFGDGRKVKDGGTAHTMSAFLARPNHGASYHLDLNTLKLYKDAIV